MKEENNQDLPEWFSLIQTSRKNYIHIWEKFSKRKEVVWNWSAFLFGPFWLLYRKMYFWVIVYHLNILLLDFANVSFANVSFANVSGIVLCIFGNKIYFSKIQREYYRKRKRSHNYKDTNKIAVIILIILNIIIITLIEKLQK